MFVIERRIAALFRAALRRCHSGPSSRVDQIPLLARLTRSGLFMHCHQEEFAVLYRQAEPTGKDVFAFPASALGQIEGRNGDPVEIGLQRPDLAQARWTERGNPRSVEIPLIDPGLVATPPELPKEFRPLPKHFVAALYESSQVTAGQDTKYIVTKVQLRGKAGSIVATDTRQLLVQGGFEFPFKEDLLLPCCDVFGLPPLSQYDDVAIGRTDTHAAIRIGPWTIMLLLYKEGRFPDATQIIPKNGSAVTRLRLHPSDAQRFLDNLVRRIKGPAAKEHALTLDLLQKPCVRFELDERIVEIPLTESQVTGSPICMCLNLAQFLRAIELRFQEFELRHPDKPLVARDGDRIYMSMPMSAHAALPPRTAASQAAPEPVRETIPAESQALAPLAQEPPSQSSAMIVVPSGSSLQPASDDSIDVFSEAEGFTNSVMRAAAHAGKLLRFLRGVCLQSNVTQVVRNSLLTLLDKPPAKE